MNKPALQKCAKIVLTGRLTPVQTKITLVQGSHV